jgi:hypothetical protein
MKRKIVKQLMITLMLFLLTAQTVPGGAAPAQQGTNLLQNPGFEWSYDKDGTANSWSRWHNETGADSKDPQCLNGYHFKPIWSVENVSAQFIHSGAVSQHIGMQWDTWKAGMLQSVPVTPGSTYRFSVFGRGRGSSEDVPAPSEQGLDMNMKIGIDPNGSDLFYDTDIVWSGKSSPHDRWDQFVVEATATGNKITVFTSANWGIQGVAQCRKHLDVWFDTAELVEVGPPPTATSPPPPPPPPATATPLPPTLTPTPEFTPTNTPVPTDTPTATPVPPMGGAICINAFADENANGLHDNNEGHMAGVTFTVASTDAVVGQAVSPGTEDPVCFDGLDPGSYQVAQIVPDRLEMTTAVNAMLEVEEGKTYGVEFGSRIRSATSEATSDPEVVAVQLTPALTDTEGMEPASPVADDGGMDLLALSGLLVLILAVIMLGALIFLVLRRQAV